MREIPLKPYPMKPRKKTLCVLDFETDPFAEGRVVKPFAAGFYIVDRGEYYDFWGDDCVEQYFAFLAEYYADEELLIYAHNGGNFDFYFCLDYFDSGMHPFIINGRLVRVFMQGQEYRDSYSAIPVSLGTYQKDVIDYALFEPEKREAHKKEILDYLKSDCLYLGQLISTWQDSFGDKLTMASVALPMLRCFHGFEEVTEDIDNKIRPYYFGGRTQAFELGELHDDWNIYDVNSMYPFVMANYQHPVSSIPIPQSGFDDSTVFARIRAYSNGCLPVRGVDGSLSFPIGEAEYFATAHEIRAGLETETLIIREVIEAYTYEVTTDFKGFVDHYYNARLEAKKNGDAINTIFLKLVLNSAYGKFAQDSRKYRQYVFDPKEPPKPQFCYFCAANPETECEQCKSGETSVFGWSVEAVRHGKVIWSRPQTKLDNQGKPFARGFFNVATAASITGASRAYLWRAIVGADRPIYCDTDSVICRSLSPDFVLDDKILGGWKTEASGDVAYIAGKKLYAVMEQGQEVKKASKGVRLTAEQIARVANGETVEYANPVPKFKLDGTAQFITRRISATGETV